MSPPTRAAGHGHHPQPAANTSNPATARSPQVPRQPTVDADLPVVPALMMLAPPDAVFDRLVVWRCEWCPFGHVHHLPIGSGESPILRSPGCAPHRQYSVEVVCIMPTPSAVNGWVVE